MTTLMKVHGVPPLFMGFKTDKDLYEAAYEVTEQTLLS